jgi:membrane fusion protein, multidrug efflux system
MSANMEMPVTNRPTILGVMWRAGAVVAAGGIIVLTSVYWNRWEGRRGWQMTEDAYLQADVTPIAAKVSGYVRTLGVEDYQRVRAGQLLAEINDDEYRASVSQAEAGVAAVEAQELALKAQITLQASNVSAARALVQATIATRDQNARDLNRQSVLLQTGSSSTEASEKLQTARQQLTAQLNQTQAQAMAALGQLDVLAAQHLQAFAAVDAQRAALTLAKINLRYTRIVATQDGVVGQREIKPGQYVAVGTQIITLSPLPHVWVIANYKETQLTHMAVGDRAKIEVDTYPGHVLRGHLVAFSPASGGQFALLPPDNATGNFTKVVQRVAVKIVIDDADGLTNRLLPGMSVVAQIDAVGREP